MAEEKRKVVRCQGCGLNQFETQDKKCRRCRIGFQAWQCLPKKVVVRATAPKPKPVQRTLVGSPPRPELELADIADVLGRATEAEFKAYFVGIARRVRDIRERREMSGAKLAKATEMGKASVSRLENGKQVMSIYRLWRIAGALGVHITELLPPKG